MYKSYFKIALRSLLRTKVETSINIIGLSLGVCCCLLIILFVKDEMTFDRFHKHSSRIYRAYAIEDWGENQKIFDTNTPFPMGPALKQNFAEVQAMTRINNISQLVRMGGQRYRETITITGSDLFEMFDFRVLSGDRQTFLKDQSDVLITEAIAKKYFGDKDPLNQVMSIELGEEFEEFVVRGVLENAPANSSIQFDIVISDLNYARLYSAELLTSGWFNIAPETYVLLQEGVNARDLEKKFPPVFNSISPVDTG